MSDQDPPEFDRQSEAQDQRVTRMLLWIGVAGLGAALAFTVVRALVVRNRAADPTGQRIQELIDEANHLLKTLDEQRHSA